MADRAAVRKEIIEAADAGVECSVAALLLEEVRRRSRPQHVVAKNHRAFTRSFVGCVFPEILFRNDIEHVTSDDFQIEWRR